MKTQQIVFHCTYLLTECNKHDHCALTVANIVNLLACHLCYVSKCSRKIISSHLIKSKVPKLSRSRTHLSSWIVISSNIANPNVKSLISENKSRSKMLIIDNPSIRRVNKTMLKINNSFVLSDLSIFSWILDDLPWIL